MTGHLLALDDARRVRARADRARLTMLRIAVCVRAAMEAVTLHDALETMTLRGAGNLHDLARREDVDLDQVAHLVLGNRLGGLSAPHPTLRRRGAEAPQEFRRRLESGLFRMTDGRARRATPARRAPCVFRASEALRPQSQLNAGHALLRLRHGDHRIRLGLDDGDGDLLPLLVEDLGHAQFATDDPDHSTLISTSTPAGKSSFVSASTVCARESRMSITRLCVLSSNCSRLFLSMCGLRSTVQSCRLVGSGIGPETFAPAFSAVRTMAAAA